MKNLGRNSLGLLMIVLLIFGLASLKGCSDSLTNPPDPKNEEEEEFEDKISGIMYLRGQKITTTYSDWPIPEGEKPTVESTYIDFIISLKLDPENPERVRIYGLEGADVGKYENMIYPNCTNTNECKVFGEMTGERSFTVDLENQGRTYTATGAFKSTDYKIVGEYNYQNIIIRYDLFAELLSE